jgi:hypothetical protein
MRLALFGGVHGGGMVRIARESKWIENGRE